MTNGTQHSFVSEPFEADREVFEAREQDTEMGNHPSEFQISTPANDDLPF